ncbi:MAG: outer membrane beta-barrel protein [Tannerellaceae bacterium]|jgi:hypothetical protein|nr:outer membrane beta-barrel protein [Tannerellaceae bacterium]
MRLEINHTINQKSKSMYKAGMIIALILLRQWAGLAQKDVKGLLLDAEEKSVPYATVSEMRAGTDEVAQVVVSGEDGSFAIRMQPGNTRLYITCIGYAPQKVDVGAEDTNLKIVLAHADYALDEVLVTAQKQAVRLGTDRLIYEMAASPLRDRTAMDALRYVPLLVPETEGVSILGKNATVFYINGRRSYMSQTALLSYLQTLPAERIRQIEVITNPNSSFRGSGNFGVINILLNENENEGVKGSVQARVWKTHYVKTGESVNLDYRMGKWSSNVSAGLAVSSDWKRSDVETVYKKDVLKTASSSLTDGSNQSYYAGVIADYKATERATLGFVASASFAGGKWNERGQTDFLTLPASRADSIIGIDYRSTSGVPEMAVNANYRVAWGARQYLNIDADYLNNLNRQQSANVLNYLDESQRPLGVYDAFEQKNPQQSSIWSGRIEYGHSLQGLANVQAGVDAYYSTIDNDDQYRTGEGSVYDPVRSNHFAVHEWTPALFVNVSRDWGDKVRAGIGGRLEYTRYEGMQRTIDERFTHEYVRALPTVYLNYMLAGSHRLSYNLSTRTSRPAFSALNPFKVYTSPNSYRTGNPYLYPSKAFSHYFQYALRSTYFLSAEYGRTNGEISRLDLLKEDNMIENKYVNMGTTDNFCATLNINTAYGDGRGNLNVSVAYNRKHIQGGAEGLSFDYISEYLHANLSHNLTVSKRRGLTCNTWVSVTTPQKNANTLYPTSMNINLDLNKRLGQWQIGLYAFAVSYVYDRQWTQTWKQIYETEDLLKHTFRKGEATSLGLRILYNFGKTQVEGSRQRNGSNATVKSRVR